LFAFVDHIYENYTFGQRTIDHQRIDLDALLHNLLKIDNNGNLGDLFTNFNANSKSLFLREDIQLIGDKIPLSSIFIKSYLKVFMDYFSSF